ncbi:MAG TPA: cytochrome b N-terminal domain-containing protein [Verrucomicrobiae bacterium]|jgi:ubiquinol-cytochrome c reductase cytochrome b subunit|nr:cytochrome b N-terminal domain-containing protein [Verrucomicrobiae bacterium]
MSRLFVWLDDRTGLRDLARAFFFPQIPGGARWRYVWGNAALFALFVQFVTGVALWFCYSPSAQTAWESVFFLQNNVAGGWFLRGLHHFNAQVLTMLLAWRLAQSIIAGTYKAPREVNFWVGLGLFLFVLAASVTGWLLPWDQKGYWSTKVATNILSISPVVGPSLQRILVGGSDYGHQTLMRFFALHAGVIPLSLLALVVAHVYLSRRHGYAATAPAAGPSVSYWPDQALRDAVACLAVMGVLIVLTVRHHGAELAPPADPTDNFSAARPEWFFLPLYQFLKLFPGGTEIVGAIILPTLLMALVALMPMTAARWRWGHRFNLCFATAVAVAAGALLWRAVAADRADPAYNLAKRQLEIDAARVKVLAESSAGIPPEGAVVLLRRDALTQGPRLFARYCASCHRFGGQDGMGGVVAGEEKASDLKGFGSAAWLTGVLDPAQVASAHYYGGTALKNGKMIKFVKTKVASFTPEQKAKLHQVIAAVAAEAQLGPQPEGDVKAGTEWLRGEMRCADCHQFREPDANASAPDLTGYASRDWLISFIGNPKQERFYGDDNDRMPAFLDEHVLNAGQIAMIADWLRSK